MEWIVLGAVVLVILYVVVVYNRLVALRQTTNQAWADVDVQLKQRHDLVPNLVETVKGYAGHERQTLEQVVAARNAAVAAHGPAEAGQAEAALSGALGRMFALAESYPDLKAATNFLELQRDLSDLENRIAAARRFFNNAVSEFNAAIEQIPAVFFAGIAGFRARTFFELGADERRQVETAPKVAF
ncbi:LemA protein [Stella humosa]|uniref:LemA protein n=1 Tax=Stella humosa TaxID=94 RepID=A0A3N1KZ51_9PROT|nr:LemA family protein [Stella humosa]ROP84702.1 LemA protein [Stella humosa]BBK34222.1 membrane protein [Stella humosa]